MQLIKGDEKNQKDLSIPLNQQQNSKNQPNEVSAKKKKKIPRIIFLKILSNFSIKKYKNLIKYYHHLQLIHLIQKIIH
jgi:hypothetical protein